MLIIAIDGACRRNGKPDCTAAGGVFVQHYIDDVLQRTEALSVYEYNSTNQRGELLALLKALDYVKAAKQEAQIITDSEYLFNAMTKQWCSNWARKGWVTSTGDAVKNKDIWLEVLRMSEAISTELHFYHIKGHCIPFGRVTADNMLSLDKTGGVLLKCIENKYINVAPTKVDVFEAAQALSERNNGFRLSDEVFRRFVTANVVVDAIATKVVDKADREN